MHKSLARYKARHILVEDMDDAEYVLDKLAAGEDFSELACEISECESSSKGGHLGLIVSGQVVPEVERALYHLEINEVSKPVLSDYGYHIIQRLPL